MKKMSYKIFAICLLCNLFVISHSFQSTTYDFSESVTSTTFDSTLAQQLQKTLDDHLVERKLIGFSAAVIMPNQGIWLGTSGMSDPVNGDSMKTDMLFWTASISKNFTAAVVLQLAEEGKLTLEDSLHQWLPSFPNIDSTITIRQLLNHTSGIFNWFDDPTIESKIFSNPDKYWTQEEIILTFTHKPYFSPGAGCHYSNNNYCLLSMIIEEATKSYFPLAMEKRLGHLTQLDHTYFAWSDTISGDFAHPWRGGNLLHKYKTAAATLLYGAGSVISTAEDIARWTKYLFEGGFLNQESLDQMLTFVAGWYGLGVMSSPFFNREFWGHTGWVPGYRTIVYYSPVDSISIAVLSNDDNASRSAIFQALLKVVYAFNHPQLLFDVKLLDLGNISLNVAMFDTTLYIIQEEGPIQSLHPSYMLEQPIQMLSQLSPLFLN